jgi:hypothetical protein
MSKNLSVKSGQKKTSLVLRVLGCQRVGVKLINLAQNSFH